MAIRPAQLVIMDAIISAVPDAGCEPSSRCGAAFIADSVLAALKDEGFTLLVPCADDMEVL